MSTLAWSVSSRFLRESPPLAYGIGSGADMLRPLAIIVIGALCISVLISLVAAPTVYFLMLRVRETNEASANEESEESKEQD